MSYFHSILSPYCRGFHLSPVLRSFDISACVEASINLWELPPQLRVLITSISSDKHIDLQCILSLCVDRQFLIFRNFPGLSLNPVLFPKSQLRARTLTVALSVTFFMWGQKFSSVLRIHLHTKIFSQFLKSLFLLSMDALFLLCSLLGK